MSALGISVRYGVRVDVLLGHSRAHSGYVARAHLLVIPGTSGGLYNQTRRVRVALTDRSMGARLCASRTSLHALPYAAAVPHFCCYSPCPGVPQTLFDGYALAIPRR